MWLNQSSQDAIRERLLQSLVQETSQPVRNKTADAVAEIARQYSDDGKGKSTGFSERLRRVLFADRFACVQEFRGMSCFLHYLHSVSQQMLDNGKLPSESLRRRRRLLAIRNSKRL